MSERNSAPGWLIVVALMDLGFAIVAVLGLFIGRAHSTSGDGSGVIRCPPGIA